ncbi:MAG: N-acetyltransferase family protein [Dehalococcoidia bacterium]
MTDTPETRVRWATPEDAATIVAFVRGLAAFEHEPLEQVHLTAADVLRDGFGARPAFECLIAEQGALDAPRPVGFALFFPNYSTWEGRAGLYVEDIFVEEDARGTGAGRAILQALARVARDRGAPRIDLAVLDWNPARGFYERLGFRRQQEWLPYRLEAAGIAALAEAAAIADAPPTAS